MTLTDICGDLSVKVFEKLGIKYDSNMLLTATCHFKEMIFLYQNDILSNTVTDEIYISMMSGMFCHLKTIYSTRMLSDGVDVLKEVISCEEFRKLIKPFL